MHEASQPVALALDEIELLGVNVQRVTRCFAFVANDRLDRIKIAQQRQACTTDHAADDCALRYGNCRSDARLGQALVAQLDDGQRLRRLDSAGDRLGRDDASPNPASPPAR